MKYTSQDTICILVEILKIQKLELEADFRRSSKKLFLS